MSTAYRKKAALQKASAGCSRVDSYFRPRAPSPMLPQLPAAELDKPESLLRTEDAQLQTITENESAAKGSEPKQPITISTHTSTVQSPDPLSTEQLESTIPTATFLDTADDNDETGNIDDSVYLQLDKLIYLAKKHKSVVALFKLHTLKMYLELYAKMKSNPRIANPAQRASLNIAQSVGKGPYFARQLRHLKVYIHRFGTLPPSRTGHHHAHSSLLNNEHILIAVRRYLTVLADGEVSTTVALLSKSQPLLAENRSLLIS
jgi:hypothetical protein